MVKIDNEQAIWVNSLADEFSIEEVESTLALLTKIRVKMKVTMTLFTTTLYF